MLQSVLYNVNDQSEKDMSSMPPFFRDLNLDKVVRAITKGREEYNILPVYFTPLYHMDTIYFRQHVMRDVQKEPVYAAIRDFSEQMKWVRGHLGQVKKMQYAAERKAWFLDAASIYCAAVEVLFNNLRTLDLESEGLSAFRNYLSEYVASTSLRRLRADVAFTRQGLDDIRYCLYIRGTTINVLRYQGQPDYSAAMEAVFARFRQGSTKDYLARFSEWMEMSHIDAAIVERLRGLFPEAFAELDRFFEVHAEFLDDVICRFDREIQFYVSYLEYIAPLIDTGLTFCYPKVTSDKNLYVKNGFDVALAHKLRLEQQPIVRNDFRLQGEERIVVISGPNQGGKTTFARMFGQLHFLASLGLPVPGTEAKLFLFDNILTHFEREESARDQNGKLKDDLIRIHEVLQHVTPSSILILNEIFSSTSLFDGLWLGRKVIDEILRRDAICVAVTFMHELADVSKQTVSMVSMVSPDNPAERTYKVLPQRADGVAYAVSLAEQYRLTYSLLKERFNHARSPHASGQRL